MRKVVYLLLFLMTGPCFAQGSVDGSGLYQQISTATEVQNLIYQTKRSVFVIALEPTSLACHLLHDLAARKVAVYLVAPAGLVNCLPNGPTVHVAIARSKSPLWILDDKTIVASGLLDASLSGKRQFALTSPSAAELIEESYSLFFPGQ